MEDKLDRILENQKLIMEALYHNSDTPIVVKRELIIGINKTAKLWKKNIK